MKRFILTPRAAQDVNDIWDYIADDNIEAADRVLHALNNAIVKLAKNPGIGHWREDLADKRHRFFLVYSYLIVYRHETKPLQIIRVLHAEHRRCRSHHRNTTAATPSYCDISLRITLSPGCRPLLISIRFTEAAPSCTATFFAE